MLLHTYSEGFSEDQFQSPELFYYSAMDFVWKDCEPQVTVGHRIRISNSLTHYPLGSDIDGI